MDQKIRLNKLVARSGISSRREADRLIAAGQVLVNGKKVVDLGTKAFESDQISVKGKVVNTQKLVYLLYNKPKNLISTVRDDAGRKTVMDTVGEAHKERIFPVGRLDRNTTGLLLMTNDGDLSARLQHPSSQVSKVYFVRLNTPLNSKDFKMLQAGISLEDGPVRIDDLSQDPSEPEKIRLTIHHGRNRIIHRTFEHLGYEVKSLDRVRYAFLTKKRLPRGSFRPLLAKEIFMLKSVAHRYSLENSNADAASRPALSTRRNTKRGAQPGQAK